MVNGWDEKFWVSSCFSPPLKTTMKKLAYLGIFHYLCGYVKKKGCGKGWKRGYRKCELVYAARMLVRGEE